MGGLTACSSNDKTQESTYVQTEMLKLDNSLDSLKMVRDEGDRAFFDYYDKSKIVIQEAKLDPYKVMDSKTSSVLTWGGVAVAGLGLIVFLGRAAYSTLKDTKRNLAVITAGILTACAGIVGQDYRTWCNHKDFDSHKEQKLYELEVEKSEYLNVPENVVEK